MQRGAELVPVIGVAGLDLHDPPQTVNRHLGIARRQQQCCLVGCKSRELGIHMRRDQRSCPQQAVQAQCRE